MEFLLSFLENSNILISISLMIILATFLAYIIKFLKQPLIIAYILTGVILSQFITGIIKDISIITSLSQIGIAFLLFIVGLEMDIRKLKDISLISSIGGIIQVILTSLLGFLVSYRFLGLSITESVYLGIIISFSSTMLVIKILSDKKELDTLHGRIIVGILLIQDILAIFFLSFLSIKTTSIISILAPFIKGIFLILLGFVLSRYAFNYLIRFAARSQELLFLSSITIALTFSLLAYFMDFSVAVGAFIAGLSLASSQYSIDIVGKINPLKDFFLTLFFVSLGMQLPILNILPNLKSIIIITLLVIVLKPLLIMFICSLFGYKKRTSFLTSLSLAQISEFSLIIILQAISFGISEKIYTIILFSTILSMIFTAYIIEYDNKIYYSLSNFLSIFEKLSAKKRDLEYKISKLKNPIIIFGGHRMGRVILEQIRKLNKKIFIVDFNPEIIKVLKNQKIPSMYGDMSNLEVLKSLPLKEAEIIISTIPLREDNLSLINYLREVNSKATIFVTAEHMHEAYELYSKGADYVILPHILAGEEISGTLSDLIKNKKSVSQLKKEHMLLLNTTKLREYQLTIH